MNINAGIGIMRPVNGLMGCLTIIVGILNTRTDTASFVLTANIALACLMYFLIVSSAMIINDIYDYKIDRVNRPKRPIPRGDITINEAKILYAFTLGSAILISVVHSIVLNLSFINVIIALFFGFTGWLYASYGKRSGFLGNIIVSTSFSAGLIYGAIVNGTNIPVFIYYFFLATFSLLMAREIIKGCEDIRGDFQQGVKTLAIRLGKRRAAMVSAFFNFMAILFLIIPVFTPIINPRSYLILMITGSTIVLYALLLTLFADPGQQDFRKISRLQKMGALIGLLAFLVASINTDALQNFLFIFRGETITLIYLC